LPSRLYGDRVTVIEFLAADIIRAVTAVVLNRKLHGIVCVSPGIILEPVGAGSRSSAVERKNSSIIRLDYSHGLVGFGDTTRGYTRQFSIDLGTRRKIRLSDPMSFWLRGSRIPVVSLGGNLNFHRRLIDMPRLGGPRSIDHIAADSKNKSAAQKKKRCYAKYARRASGPVKFCRHSIWKLI
jgi:hypothetical protein